MNKLDNDDLQDIKDTVGVAVILVKEAMTQITDTNEFAALNAKFTKQLFDAHLANGFNRDEAMNLVTSALRAGLQLNTKS